jgi:hypothetical protein
MLPEVNERPLYFEIYFLRYSTKQIHPKEITLFKFIFLVALQTMLIIL